MSKVSEFASVCRNCGVVITAVVNSKFWVDGKGYARCSQTGGKGTRHQPLMRKAAELIMHRER
jgi:hypothetical protein